MSDSQVMGVLIKISNDVGQIKGCIPGLITEINDNKKSIENLQQNCQRNHYTRWDPPPRQYKPKQNQNKLHSIINIIAEHKAISAATVMLVTGIITTIALVA